MINYQPDEVFDLVDDDGKIIGQAPRRRCHGDPSLRHRAVHVLVFDEGGRLFLQKRSTLKDTAPGLWDTSVGGHMQPGETPLESAQREFAEELGVPPSPMLPAYTYEWSTPFETELIHAFATLHAGPFTLATEEIEEGRFWDQAELESALTNGPFTPQLKKEFSRMKAWWAENSHTLKRSTS